MRKYLAAALAAILTVGVAHAQAPAGPSTPPSAGATATFTLAPADMTKLKDWITAQNTASANAPAGFNLAVGEALPMTIQLHQITASAGVPSAEKNEYAVVGGKIVLADPASRKIVYVFS